MTPRAIGEYIFVKHVPKPETKTGTGIYISQSEKDRDVHLAYGEFVSAGDKVNLILSKDDVLLYNSYDANTFEQGTETYHVIHQDHVKGLAP